MMDLEQAIKELYGQAENLYNDKMKIKRRLDVTDWAELAEDLLDLISDFKDKYTAEPGGYDRPFDR